METSVACDDSTFIGHPSASLFVPLQISCSREKEQLVIIYRRFCAKIWGSDLIPLLALNKRKWRIKCWGTTFSTFSFPMRHNAINENTRYFEKSYVCLNQT